MGTNLSISDTFMPRIITYQEGRFSTIQLDSGEKVMLSVAQTGIVIFQMKFLGLLPGRKIAEWSLDDLPDFIARLGGDTPTGSPFRYAVDQIATFTSIRELESALS